MFWNVTGPSISIPGAVYNNTDANQVGTFFTFYNTSVLFPLATNGSNVTVHDGIGIGVFNTTNVTIGSAVISATIVGVNTSVLAVPVEVTLPLFPVPSLDGNNATVSYERMSTLHVSREADRIHHFKE